MTSSQFERKPEFENALARLPDGYPEGRFRGRLGGVTVKRSADRKRLWLYGEEFGGTDIESFNLYLLSGETVALRPCEMSRSKVVDFVVEFDPLGRQLKGEGPSAREGGGSGGAEPAAGT